MIVCSATLHSFEVKKLAVRKQKLYTSIIHVKNTCITLGAVTCCSFYCKLQFRLRPTCEQLSVMKRLTVIKKNVNQTCYVSNSITLSSSVYSFFVQVAKKVAALSSALNLVSLLWDNLIIETLAVCSFVNVVKASFILFQEKIMHFPTWVDLKGRDSVPETVHHVVSLKMLAFHFFTIETKMLDVWTRFTLHRAEILLVEFNGCVFPLRYFNLLTC